MIDTQQELLRSIVIEIRELKEQVKQLQSTAPLKGIRDASELLGMSERSLWRGVQEGRYPGYRHGSRTFVDPTEIRKIMAQTK
jgi:predicted DNA-binding transcriptional regulator AlpA